MASEVIPSGFCDCRSMGAIKVEMGRSICLKCGKERNYAGKQGMASAAAIREEREEWSDGTVVTEVNEKTGVVTINTPLEDNSPVRPAHYRRGKIEVWDFIMDQGLSFMRGTVIKYICRAGHKDDELEDLMKAKAYLEREIKRVKGE